MDKSDALYQASMCSMIQELMRVRKDIDKRIDDLFNELSNEAWFSEFFDIVEPKETFLRLVKNDEPDDYKMD